VTVLIVFGRQASSIEAILDIFRIHGDALRAPYRARYEWDPRAPDPYTGAVLERPPALRDNPPNVVFPWEQIFVAAATCAGSDYPMIAAHEKIPLERVELVVEGVFDPRPEFHGLGGFEAQSLHAYGSIHLRASLTSAAPRRVLEELHARVVERNMVLDALRGVPRTSELAIHTH
jgi:hypothetical protein